MLAGQDSGPPIYSAADDADDYSERVDSFLS